VNGTVSSVSVSCTTNTYTIGGSVSGLTANGLVLTDNGGNALSVSSGASSFTFSTPLSYNASYTVAVSTQPTGQLCTVASASGTVTATVTSVTVSCVASFTISGTISGLTVSSVVLANGTATVTVSAGASSWAFTGSFASGAAYAVTVQTQPTGETCQVTSAASGTLNANVSNVTVVCGYGQWTWQSGGNGDNESGVYGTLGTASASNVPRGEAYGMSWIDLSGNMWFFGGFGTSSSWYNNLWKYSPSSGEWTWENGSSSSGAHGVYGTKGVAAATNVPGARSSGVTWVDSSGNLWMFGGYGYDVNGNNSDLNDLWEYSPSSGEWTWVGGSNTVSASGVYGTKGTASASNIPGARAGPVTWKDASGNFWLFGGNNQSGDFNDLWTYNLSTGQWTWVSGSNGQNADGTYGTLGTASSSNVPPSEAYGTSWIDLSGNMWFFGGNNTSNDLNNLWKYNPSTGQWTWEGGTSGVNAHGVYGTLGVASSSNVPGARENPMSWTDSSGNFWLFGGLGYGSSGSSAGYLNDVWEFSTSSGQWTWVSGASSTNASGVYGTEGTASVGNVPGGRWGSFTWIDSSGNLWMLGGDGYDAAGGFGFLDDLWEFTPLQ
jgi:N-acetylneuraminic acid mutarotase